MKGFIDHGLVQTSLIFKLNEILITNKNNIGYVVLVAGNENYKQTIETLMRKQIDFKLVCYNDLTVSPLAKGLKPEYILKIDNFWDSISVPLRGNMNNPMMPMVNNNQFI
jgi:hypothetical protein